MKTANLSKTILREVIRELGNCRGGFDDWWYSVDLEIRLEMTKTLKAIIEFELRDALRENENED